MDQGRQRWQQLGELGVSFAAVEQELQQLEPLEPEHLLALRHQQ
jgi:hypothetical protein